MVDKVSDRTEQTKDIVAGGLAIATLIVADKVTLLHFLFGLPLFIYLIRDFKKRSTLSDRLIVTMAMSFVTLLFTCYPIELILNKLEEPPDWADWDIILAIQWFIVLPFVWVVRAEFELRMSRGKA